MKRFWQALTLILFIVVMLALYYYSSELGF